MAVQPDGRSSWIHLYSETDHVGPATAAAPCFARYHCTRGTESGAVLIWRARQVEHKQNTIPLPYLGSEFHRYIENQVSVGLRP